MSDPDIIAEARRWLRYAQEDLAAALANVSQGGAPRHACWFAQQSAEKTLKSVLIFCQIDFPRTHDLDLLRTLIPKEWRCREALSDGASLTEWAVESRYPGDWPDATPADAAAALSIACAVIAAAESQLAQRGL